MPSYGVLVPGNPTLMAVRPTNRETAWHAAFTSREVAQGRRSVCGWVSLMVNWDQPEKHGCWPQPTTSLEARWHGVSARGEQQSASTLAAGLGAVPQTLSPRCQALLRCSLFRGSVLWSTGSLELADQQVCLDQQVCSDQQVCLDQQVWETC